MQLTLSTRSEYVQSPRSTSGACDREEKSMITSTSPGEIEVRGALRVAWAAGPRAAKRFEAFRPGAQLAAEDRPRMAEGLLDSGYYCELGNALNGWHKEVRVCPQGSKPRAQARHPWEARVADLAEVLHWKTALAWTDPSPVHINSLEVRGRLKLGRRLARRRQLHHQRVNTLGDSRVQQGASSKGRSPSDTLAGDLRRGVPDSLGADLAWQTWSGRLGLALDWLADLA